MVEEPFIIPVNYKGIDREFEARLQVWGYTHRFHVQVECVEVIFERDEEGKYRAVIPPETPVKPADIGLLKAIAEAIEQILA